MARTATARAAESGLTAAQERAAVMLAGGSTVTQAAEAVGVSRQTVSTWANSDPQFIVFVNTMRGEALKAGADRLRSIMMKALDAVEAAFDSEDLTAKERAALGMELRRVGATNPQQIRREQEMARMLDGML